MKRNLMENLVNLMTERNAAQVDVETTRGHARAAQEQVMYWEEVYDRLGGDWQAARNLDAAYAKYEALEEAVAEAEERANLLIAAEVLLREAVEKLEELGIE